MAKLAADNGVAVADADVDAQVTDEATDAGAAPRLDDRGRAGAGPEDRRGRRRGEANAPSGWPSARSARLKQRRVLGGRRQDRLRLRQSRRRPATSAGSRRTAATTRRSWTPCSRAELNAAHRRGRGRGRDLPHRPGHRGGRRGGRPRRSSRRSRTPGSARRLPRRGPSATSSARSSSDKVVADLRQARRRSATCSRSTCPSRTRSTAGDRAGREGPLDRVRAERRHWPRRRTLPADDPAWAEGQGGGGRRLRGRSRRHPEKFDAMARTGVRRASGEDHRRQAALDLPVDADRHRDQERDPRRRPARTASSSRRSRATVGWLRHPVHARPTGEGEDACLKTLKAKATDDAAFRQLAMDNSEATEAKDGGDIGWIAKDQLDRRARHGGLRRPAIGSDSDVGHGVRRRLVPVPGPRRGDPRRRPTTSSRSSRTAASTTGTRARRKPPRSTYNIGSDAGTGGPARPHARRPRRRGARPAGASTSAAGLQVVAAERLIGTPIEASRPLLVVPLAVLGEAPVARAPRRPAAASSRSRAATAPLGRDPLAVLWRASTRPTPRWRGSAIPRPRRRPIGDADARRPGPAAVRPADRAGARRRRALGDALHQRPPAPARTAARGIASRPTRRCASTCSRRRTRSTTRSSAARRRSSPRSSATCCSRSCSTPSSRPRLASSTSPTSRPSIARKIVRRHPHVFGDAVARTAADVNRQWERIKADERAEAAGSSGARRRPDARAEERPRRHQPVDAGPRRQPGDAGARRRARLRLAGRRGRARQGRRGARRAGARPTTARSGSEEFGDLLLVVVNVGRKLGHRAEAALRAANHKFRAASGASSGWPPSAASRCATSISRPSTSCGMLPRPRSARAAGARPMAVGSEGAR